MQIVVIGYVWPEPNSSAAGQNMLNLLEAFTARNCSVTFLSAASESVHALDLAAIGVASMSIALNHDSFNAVIAELNPDLVVFDRFMIEEQFAWRVRKVCPDALCVLNTEDLHALRDARHQQLKRQQSDIQLTSDLFLREIASILRCDMTLLVSEHERQFLLEHFPFTASLLWVYPLLPAFAESITPTFKQRKDYVFIGNFRHAPNWDAVLQLKQLWPSIRNKTPTAELHIYGAYPPPKATQLHAPKTGFHIDGWVQDAHQVLKNARVCIAPLRFGAGVKGKFLDAFQTGTPCVTSPIGIEGICAPQQWPGAVSSNDESFCNSAAHLYLDQNSWQRAHQKAISMAKTNDDRRVQNNALCDALKAQLETLETHRQNNFLGAMLRHHQHASTQYMSQWIASKTALKELQDSLPTDPK